MGGMNVNLTPQLEELVREKVESGMYTSASEVVREALRLLQEQDRMKEVRLGQLRHDIELGLRSGRGEAWDAGQVKRQGRLRKAARSKGAKA
jgi:antitoxin ParD1/3/4